MAVRTRARREQATVVTSARRPKSLDVAERQRRYIWTMGFRTLCFAVVIFVPDAWKIALIVIATVLPPVAVLLANNVDLRTTPDEHEDEPAEPLAGALTSGVVIPHPKPTDAGAHAAAD